MAKCRVGGDVLVEVLCTNINGAISTIVKPELLPGLMFISLCVSGYYKSCTAGFLSGNGGPLSHFTIIGYGGEIRSSLDRGNLGVAQKLERNIADLDKN